MLRRAEAVDLLASTTPGSMVVVPNLEFPIAKAAVQLKKPYAKGTFSRVKHARYLGWENAFDVEFEDGLCFLEPHSAIRKANGISAKAQPARVEVDEDVGSQFKVTYDTGEVAEVSWSFVRELPPKR